MGWFLESGFIDYDWMGYNEVMMVYIFVFGLLIYLVSFDVWMVWMCIYDNDWGVYQGQEYLFFGLLFGYQYMYVWVDFCDIQDVYMCEWGSIYFFNSWLVVLVQCEYVIVNLMNWKDYGENVWGLIVSDGLQNIMQEYCGEQCQFWYYFLCGVGLCENFDDGIIVLIVVIVLIVFVLEEVILVIEEMYKCYGDYIYFSYGFLDLFNFSFNYDILIKIGCLVLDCGWVVSDYIGIDQGLILIMIVNYWNDFVWDVMKKNLYICKGLECVGFSGGWLILEGEMVLMMLQKDEKVVLV